LSILKDSSITFVSLFITLIATMAWGIITAHTLGPSGKGVLAVAIFYPTAFFTIGHLTINIMNIHFIGKGGYSLEEFAGNSLFFALTISSILYLLFLITFPVFGKTLYKAVPPRFLYLAFAIMPLVFIIYYFRSLLQGVQKIVQFNLVGVFSSLFKLPLLLLLVVFKSYGVMGALVAALAGLGFGALLSIYYTKKAAPGRWKLNRELMRKVLSGGSKMHVSSISTFLYGYMEIALVNYFLTSVHVGYIAVAIAVSQVLFLLSYAISTVLYPEVSKKGMAEAEQVNSIVCRNAFMLIIIFMILFVIFAKYVVLLYAGRAFLPAVLPMQIILVGACMSTFSQLMSPLWVRKGWFWQLSLLALMLLGINLLLNIYMIPRYGIVGAAWSKLITYAAGFIQISIIYFIYVDKRFWRAFVPQKSDLELYQAAWRRYILRKKDAAVAG
jgi:O-antigen/teichoic acid export membrane protein